MIHYSGNHLGDTNLDGIEQIIHDPSLDPLPTIGIINHHTSVRIPLSTEEGGEPFSLARSNCPGIMGICTRLKEGNRIRHFIHHAYQLVFRYVRCMPKEDEIANIKVGSTCQND